MSADESPTPVEEPWDEPGQWSDPDPETYVCVSVRDAVLIDLEEQLRRLHEEPPTGQDDGVP
jgi:hypothetical protein